MWTLVLIIAVNGGLFDSSHLAMTSITGFSSKENCEKEAKNLVSENISGKAGFVTKCIEVK